MRKEPNDEFDDAFLDGVFAIPNPLGIKVKVGALLDYCKKQGVKPDELTEEEMAQFLERNV